MDAHAKQMLDVSEKAHFDSATSLVVFAGGVGILTLLLLVSVASLIRNRLRARMADASFEPTAQLRPGESVVSGVVELSAEAAHAVRVEVDQAGDESESSGTWSHTWKEVDRRVKVAPFYVRHVSGLRLRVEPGREVLLVDELDATVQIELTERTRIAELTPGEHVMVHGRLVVGSDPYAQTEGYRGGPAEALVLRPVGSKPMMMSTEALGSRFRRHARAAAWSTLTVAIAMAVFAGLTATYQVSMFTGRVVPVTLLQRSYYVVDDDEDVWKPEYWISVGGEGRPAVVEVEVEDDDFVRLRKGMTLAYRDVAVWRGHLGVRPKMNIALAVLASIVVVVASIVWTMIRRTHRKWYERPRVVDEGAGRLKMPEGS